MDQRLLPRVGIVCLRVGWDGWVDHAL